MGDTTNFDSNIYLNNSVLDLMDSQHRFTKTDLVFDSLNVNNNSKLNIDIFVQDSTSDTITVNSGSGILNINSLSFNKDFGNKDEFTVQVIHNNNGATVALAQDVEIAPQVAGWSTNLYEYKIDAAKSSGSSVFDSLKFEAEEATPNSLKIMNNYTLTPTRGFSLLEDAPVYNIAQDLGKTEYGTFTVNGISADESIISGYRLSYEENADGTINHYNKDDNGNYIVTEEKKSFFELTEQDKTTSFNLNNITIQDAARTNQTIKDGSVLYMTQSNASFNNVLLENNSASGNGGAIAISGGKLSLKNTEFKNNKSDKNGGALYVSGGTANISDTTNFTNNYAKENGGAVYNTSNNLTISGSNTFSGNIADSNGGAFYNQGKITISNAVFENNTASNGSAIYNDKNGTITLTNPKFTANSGSSYIYNNGNMTITAQNDLNLQNNTTANIVNNGTLNLNNTINIYDAITSETTSAGIINAKGDISVFNTVTNQNINLSNGTLTIGTANNTNTDALLNNTDLTINKDTTAILNNNSINGGVITTNGNFNIINSSDIEISADLSGAGTINKDNNGTLTLNGHSNDDFNGSLNINGGTVQFNKTPDNTFFDNSTEINVNNAVFEYNSTDSKSEFSGDTFAKVTLNDNSTVQISGNDKNSSHYTINSGWLQSNNETNSLIFENADYLISNSFINNENHKGNITFNSSVVNFEIDDNASSQKDYNITSNSYTLNDSTLDINNEIAGDNYNFDSLNMNKDSKLALDVNLNLELDN